MNYSDWSRINPLATERFRTGLYALLVAFGGCSTETTPELVENGYPTQARVEYVLECMEKNGGQNLDSLYPCVCSIDKIALKMPYDDFAEAQTFTAMRSAPGEAGGLFRDPPRAKELRQKLEEAEAFARSNCFVKHVKAEDS